MPAPGTTTSTVAGVSPAHGVGVTAHGLRGGGTAMSAPTTGQLWPRGNP